MSLRRQIGPRAFMLGSELDAIDVISWKCETLVQKYWAPSMQKSGRKQRPYEELYVPGNVLLRGGADALWGCLLHRSPWTTGAGAGSTKSAFFNSTSKSYILIGSGSTAALSTQVDLGGSSAPTQRMIQRCDNNPTHTTGALLTTNTITVFKGTVTTGTSTGRGHGNFHWNEWGIGNSSKMTKPYLGRLLNRKVQDLGIKTSDANWVITVTLSLA